jgi:hypothetical protein
MDDDTTIERPPFRTNKHLHPKVKEVVVQLCFWFTAEEVASYLDIHPRTVRRIWKLYKETGSIVPDSTETIGCPLILDWMHGAVSLSCFAYIPVLMFYLQSI